MVIGSSMKGPAQERFTAAMEAQGARTRKTKNGLMVYAPDGATLTVHTTYGDRRSLVNDIAWFRRHGLRHPSDTSPHHNEEETEVGRKAETNDEGYPHYMVGPINGTTRKRVLAELESKGWPLRVMATELNMDTVTAQRALYAVGYRWDPQSPPKRRAWLAPDDIKEMHEKVKAEMKRREDEAKEARHAAQSTVIVEPGAIVITATDTPSPQDVADAIAAGTAEKIAIPFRNPGKPIGEAFTPEFVDEHTTPEKRPLRPEAPPITKPVLHVGTTRPAFDSLKPSEPEREFIDSVDSWTANENDAPTPVREYLRGLRAAGLEVEIRVWRKP